MSRAAERGAFVAALLVLVLAAGIAVGVLIARDEPEPELADRLDGISSTVLCAQTGVGCDG